MADLFTLRVFARNLLRDSRRNIFHISFFFFSFFFVDLPGIPTQTFASSKPTPYILDHGDYNVHKQKYLEERKWKGMEFWALIRFTRSPKWFRDSTNG